MKRCTCKPNRSRRDGVDQYLTPAGSPSASAFRVGKIIGGDLYIHASALPFLPAPVRDLVVERHAVIDGAPYDLVKWSPKTGAVAFIETAGWDELPEPLMGVVRSVSADGRVATRDYGPQQMIYHHKWQFVGPGYAGFSVAQSMARSDHWEHHPHVLRLKREGLDGKRFSSLIGHLPVWREHVLDVLFPGDGALYDAFPGARR